MRLNRPIPIASLILSILAGCEPDGVPPGSEVDPLMQTKTEGPVWKPTSVRLELSTFNFWDGSMAYEITRDLLTPQQLSHLAALRVISTPPGPLGADFASYRIRVTDRSGEVITYRAAQDDVVDSDEGPTSGVPTLQYETLTPFLATFHCISAKENWTGREDASDPWRGAATFSSDPGCKNGVFVTSEDSHSYRTWRIDAAGTYRLSVESCFQQMRLHLFDVTGKEELVVSTAANAPECPSLVYSFTAPGEYRVDLEKNRNPSAPRDTAGDTFLRVSRE